MSIHRLPPTPSLGFIRATLGGGCVKLAIATFYHGSPNLSGFPSYRGSRDRERLEELPRARNLE